MLSLLSLVKKNLMLGGESGLLNNTRRWQRSTPMIHRSPFTVQGDIGKIYSIF